MMRSIIQFAIVAGLAMLTLTVFAQYTGPTSVPHSTARALMESGRDKQPAVLQGRIVSHDGGKRYTFADDSGRLPLEISPKYLPQGRPFDERQRVELTGKLDKDFRKTEFEVKQLRLLD